MTKTTFRCKTNCGKRHNEPPCEVTIFTEGFEPKTGPKGCILNGQHADFDKIKTEVST